MLLTKEIIYISIDNKYSYMYFPRFIHFLKSMTFKMKMSYFCNTSPSHVVCENI